MLVRINKGASENDDDDENEDEIKVTRVFFMASIVFYFNTAKSTYNIQKYQALPQLCIILQTGNCPYLCLYIAGMSSHTSLYGRKLHDIYSLNRNSMIV